MRTLLAIALALPLVHAQDARLLKAVEPRYDQYSTELATNFETANARVILNVLATGKPFSLEGSNLPLPMAVAMALKDYEFQPLDTVPHGRLEVERVTYQVTLNIPIRQTRDLESRTLVNPGIAKCLLVKQVRPAYPDSARAGRIQALIPLQAAIDEEGFVEGVRASSGPLVLIEAAYEAVRQWQFRPFLQNRQPVPVLADLQLNFSLD
jgi:hypothetical protein